jgi:hypothetical protein
VSGYEQRTGVLRFTSANNRSGSVLASCTQGKSVIGGGALLDLAPRSTTITASFPAQNVAGWVAKYESSNPGTGGEIRVFAICAFVS